MICKKCKKQIEYDTHQYVYNKAKAGYDYLCRTVKNVLIMKKKSKDSEK